MTNEIRSLNTLRGIAALIVVISHYSNHSRYLDGLFGDGAGQIGVMLFFVLSAFLITILYLNKKSSKSNISIFISARFARVVPLYLLVVFLSFFAHLLMPENISKIAYKIDSLKSLIEHLILLKGDSVLWTIPPEIQFYGIFVLVWIASNKFPNFSINISLTIIALYVFGPAVTVPRGQVIGLDFILYLTRGYPYFCMGVLLGVLHSRWSCPEKFKRNFFVFVVLFLPLMFPKISSAIIGVDWQIYKNNLWQNIYVFVTISLVFFVVVFLVPIGNRLLSNTVGDFLGRVSYSSYLLHMPILLTLKKIGLTAGLYGGIFYVFVVLACSHLMFRWFESPARQLINNRFSVNQQ